MLADIDRACNGANDSRRKGNLFRKLNENDDGYEAGNGGSGDNTDISNRNNSNRQSKSANAARSLTRKN